MKTALSSIFTMLLYGAVAQQPVEKNVPSSTHHLLSLEDSSILQTNASRFGINEGWSIYKDIIFPGTGIKGKLKHNKSFLPGSTLLNCRITGGDAYNNLFFTYTIAKKWMCEPWEFSNANSFTYSLDFYIDNNVDCNVPDLSEVEGLEFIFQQAMPPYSNLWGLQWSKSNIWCYWDDTKVNHRAKGWIQIAGLNTCMLNKQWSHISITGHRNDTGLFYDKLFLNNVSFNIDVFVPKAYLPTSWSENYLQVGFQINGNKSIRNDHKNGLDPVSVYLDNVQLDIK